MGSLELFNTCPNAFSLLASRLSRLLILLSPFTLALRVLERCQLQIEPLGVLRVEEQIVVVGLEIIQSKFFQGLQLTLLTVEHEGMGGGYLLPETIILHFQVEIFLTDLDTHCLHLDVKIFLGKFFSNLLVDRVQEFVNAVDNVFA